MFSLLKGGLSGQSNSPQKPYSVITPVIPIIKLYLLSPPDPPSNYGLYLSFRVRVLDFYQLFPLLSGYGKQCQTLL